MKKLGIVSAIVLALGVSSIASAQRFYRARVWVPVHRHYYYHPRVYVDGYYPAPAYLPYYAPAPYYYSPGVSVGVGFGFGFGGHFRGGFRGGFHRF